jgi:DeoR family galactitol utilization operon repressor
MKSSQFEREKEVLRLITSDSSLSVTEISDMLGVSTVTIRSDLASLEAQGYIIRSRGGAHPAFHPEILRRQTSQLDEKNRIARKAASFVNDGDTIMIEAGTTTALIAKYLAGKRNIRIVTNSTLIVPYARSNPGIHLSVVGGTFRPETEALVGPMALSSLDSFYVKTAFVGTDGFSLENGLSSHFLEAAAVLKKVVERSEKTILVADSSKYGNTGFVSILPITAVSKIVTDSGLSDGAVEQLKKRGVEVVLV